jgi:hypothetical protein
VDAGLARAISRSLDRAGPVLLGCLVALMLWMASAASAAKPLWHDEIYTYLIAKLPSVAMIWGAHRDGVDLQPPLNTLVTRAAHRAFGSGPTVTRLPALAGFGVLVVVVACLLRRRAGTTLALAGALIPVQTAAYRYSYEARGYGLMVGFFALAVFAWAESARGSRRALWIPVLAAALAAGVWAHYYAAYAFVAIGCGEAVRALRTRRLDGPVLAGMLAGGLLTLPLISLVVNALEQAPHFWTTGAGEETTTVSRFLLGPLWAVLWGPAGAAVAAALGFTAGSAWLRRSRTRSTDAGVDRRVASATPAHEVAALICTLAAPAVMLTAARLSGGAFTARYGLAVVVAVAIGLPLIIRWLAPRGSLAEVVLLGVFAWPVLAGAPGFSPPPAVDPVAQRPLLAAALRRPGPVVASGSLTFLQFWFYAPPLERGRLIYLADPDRELRATGTDTFDRGYLALARWTALPVRRYEAFIDEHHEFTLYASGSGWLLGALEAHGATLELRGAEAGGREFRVTR